jgi:hypothetical protein
VEERVRTEHLGPPPARAPHHVTCRRPGRGRRHGAFKKFCKIF